LRVDTQGKKVNVFSVDEDRRVLHVHLDLLIEYICKKERKVQLNQS